MGRHRASLYVGLSVCLLVMASLACSLSSGANGEPSADESTPLVLLLAPINNSIFAEGAEVELYALAQDIQDRIARMEFRINDVPLQDSPTLTEPTPGTLAARAQWTAAGQSKHVVTVEAFREDGLTLGMTDIVISVVSPPGGPSGVASQPETAVGVPTEVPVPAPTSAAPQFDMGILAGPTARVRVTELNVRQGPGTQYPSVGTLSAGDTIEIVGRNADSSWLAIEFRGGSAWVFADLVAPDGDISNVPLVASP